MTLFRFIYLSLIATLLCVWGFQVYSERSALAAVESWARVAPVKSCGSKPVVETAGGAFTREFFVEITCEKEALQKWLNNSPGLQDARVTEKTTNSNVYSITPGGGASFAEVEIDWNTSTVKLRAYWS